MSDDKELEALRRRRMDEMLNQQQGGSEEESEKRAEEKKAALRQIMTPEARERLTNIRMVNPVLVEKIEMQLISLAQNGRLGQRVTDEMLKKILQQFQSRKRDVNIRRI